MKISILTTKNSHNYENSRFLEEIKRYNNVDLLYLNYLNYPDFLISLDYDIYYFYAPVAMNIDVYFLANELKEKGKIIINKNISEIRMLDKSYFYYIAYKKGFKIPKTVKIYSIKNLEKLNELSFPIVVKHIGMHRGMGVNLIENKEKLIEFIKQNKSKLKYYIFQEFINYDKDIRIIFVGEPIGGMERINNGSFKANISQGGMGRKFELNKELIELSYRLSDVFNMQIFAFDVLIKNDEYYIIDIHRTFQFQGFEKYTGVNVARKIIEYLNGIRY